MSSNSVGLHAMHKRPFCAPDLGESPHWLEWQYWHLR